MPLLSQDKPAALPIVTAFECPRYPSDAKSLRLQGVVQMQVTTDGHAVSDVKVLPSHPVLAREAMKNVRTWKFADHKPTTFIVTFVYELETHYKRDPETQCTAKLSLPSEVRVGY